MPNFMMYNPNTQANQAQGAQLNTGQYNQDRQGLQTLIGRYGQMANGQGPSLVPGQLQAGLVQAQQQALGLANGARGVSPGGALYGAQQAMGNMGAQVAGQAAALRSQEQQQAMGAQGTLLGAQMGSDLGLAGQNAQLAQQNQQFNAGASNTMLGQSNDIMSQQFAQQNQYLAQQALQKQQQDLALRNSLINGVVGAAGSMGSAGLMSGAMGGGGAAAGAGALTGAGGAGLSMGLPMLALASDERAKTDIKPGRSRLGEMMEQLGAHDYEYSEPEKPGRSPGRHVSVMAQELERSELGKRLVFDGPGGTKMVDYGKALPTMLAAMAELWNDRKAA